MILNLLLLLLPLLIVVEWRGGEHRSARHGLGVSVRRFFQYGLTFGALMLVAVGLSGLLTRTFERGVLVAEDGAALARGLSFSIVGLPLLAVLLLWVRRSARSDPTEKRSLAAFVMLALSELVSLGVFATNVQIVLRGLLSVTAYDPGALAQTIVWGAVWYLYRRAHEGVDLRDYIGATIALWMSGAGLATFIGAVIRGVTVVSSRQLAATNDRPIASAVVMFCVGAAIWWVYWIGTTQSARHTTLWHAYVLLAGVAGGLIAAIIAASTVLYDGLVWIAGTPSSVDAAAHFHGTPGATGIVIAGVLVWWYHRTVLADAGRTTRDETRRVYEYLVAGIGLIAAAVGLMILVVALIESATASAQIAGSGAENTLLLAVTLLGVGAPVWWFYWALIRRALREDTFAEVASMTRRVYLLLLFGVVGVAAVVALLIAVYFFFDDLVSGRLALATLRRMRWGIGVLLSAGSIAGYHWSVFAAERESMPTDAHRRIVVIGPNIPGLREEIANQFHVRVEHLVTADTVEVPEVQSVLHAIAGVHGREVAVMVDGLTVRAVACERE